MIFRRIVQHVILNETAARQLGWLDDFEGKVLISFARNENGTPMRVIGIVKDFNYETLKSDVKPMAIIAGRNTELRNGYTHSAERRGRGK